MYVCPECGESSGNAGACSADGEKLVASNDPILGQMVGSYRLARLIGAGGMGRVYKGVQPAIGSRVAIKLLSPQCAGNPGLVERFFAEARAVNVIRHESIVNVLDLAALPDGQPYIVMEYLDGEPLSALIQRCGPLPLGSVTRLVTEVLGALAAAHDKGIIHRDLKPDNIFVTTGGRAKVLDFGIAKLKPGIADLHDATRTGSLLGTPHYMSPEQAQGRQVDARSDLYSVGIILFETVTGRRAFDSTALYELLRQHIEQPPPAPRSLRVDIPPAYELCVLRALEKDPSRRFQSAREFASALGQAARFLPETSWVPLPVSRGPHGTSPMRSVAGTPLAPSAFQAQGPHPHANLGPTVGAPQPGAAQPASDWRTAGVPSGAPTPAVPYSPVAQPAPLVSVAGYANTFGGGAPPARPRRSLLPYFLIGAFTLLMLAGMGTYVVLVRMRQRPHTPRRHAEATPKRPATPQLPAMPQFPAAPTPAPGTSAFKLNLFGPNAPRYLTSPHYKMKLEHPKHFEVSAFLPEALKMARRHEKDVVLIRLDAYGVRPDGSVDLTYGTNSVLYRFRSPSASKRPPGTPDNAQFMGSCLVYVSVQRTGITSYIAPGLGCKTRLIGMPHCSATQVWNEAKKDGAPGGNVVGTLGYRANEKGRRGWYVDVPPTFDKWYADSCAR